ncbi:MAG: hypothetical protein Q9215_004881 [Flavoplaca cf. flavocitrina]
MTPAMIEPGYDFLTQEMCQLVFFGLLRIKREEFTICLPSLPLTTNKERLTAVTSLKPIAQAFDIVWCRLGNFAQRQALKQRPILIIKLETLQFGLEMEYFRLHIELTLQIQIIKATEDRRFFMR